MSLFFTKDEISSMSFDKTPNKILVKPTRGSDEINLPGGIKICMDSRFGKEKHAPTTGIIKGLCKKLITSKMPWETENELQLNDYIVYSYESAMYAMEEMHGRTIIDEDGEVYFIIDYEDIFLVEREKNILPVNGYILASPIEEKTAAFFEIVKENKNSARFACIEYIGNPNKKYIFSGKTREDVFDCSCTLKKGDIIVFNRDSDIPVEYPLHRSIGDRSKILFRLQRKDIDAIIPNSQKNIFGM